MKGGAAALAAIALAAPALAACARQTELLPDTSAALPLCPTDIDVYGDDDTLFALCGGPAMLVPSPAGLFEPGAAGYDATLAGRLQVALSSDAALASRFGRPFRVRACGSPGAALSSLSPEAVTDECGPPDAPPLVAGVSSSCTNEPGQVMVIVASEPRDSCHGGDDHSARTGDEGGYAAHFAARLQALVAARKPLLTIAGAQTEWTPLPGVAIEDPAACTWPRGDWSRGGLSAWKALHGAADDVRLVGDLHDAFKRRSQCCQALGLPCERPEWLERPSGMAPARVTCEGAGRILAYWVAVVRGMLGNTRFACEG